jgi:hypothetical protein
MMWKKRGPRKCAWYAMEMDRVKPRHSKRSKANSESMEDRHEIHCSKCHKVACVNATKPATTDEDVKRMYVLSI